MRVLSRLQPVAVRALLLLLAWRAGNASAGGGDEDDDARTATATFATAPDPGPFTAAPRSLLHDRMQVLSWPDRVFLIDHFLSDAEADELVGMGHGALTRMHGDEWRERHAYSNVLFTPEDYAASATLQALEDRIDLLTMVPPHDNEIPIMFTRQIPGTRTGTFLPDQVLRNVHHDKNMRENRIVTVLVYLSDAAPGDGGHTLFPCLPGKSGTLAKAMQQKLHRLFDDGTRIVEMGHADAQHRDLLVALNQQCLLADQSDVLSVAPRKGTALVFWSVRPDGLPTPNAWHGACQAMGGPHRYAVQKFKELPRSTGEWRLDPATRRPVFEDFLPRLPGGGASWAQQRPGSTPPPPPQQPPPPSPQRQRQRPQYESKEQQRKLLQLVAQALGGNAGGPAAPAVASTAAGVPDSAAQAEWQEAVRRALAKAKQVQAAAAAAGAAGLPGGAGRLAPKHGQNDRAEEEGEEEDEDEEDEEDEDEEDEDEEEVVVVAAAAGRDDL